MALPPRNQPGGPPARPAAAPGPPRGAAAPAPRAAAPQPAPAAARVDWSDPKYRASLVRRGEESYRTKGGETRYGLIDFDKLKEHNLNLWQWSTGKKFWDIIPYLCGPQEPLVYLGKLQKGDGVYTTGVYFHRIGPKGMDKIVCLAKTFGLPCPICEHREQLDRNPNGASEMGMSEKDFDDYIKTMLPSKYQNFLYYIWDRDAENKGIQVASISGMFFEEALQIQAYSSRGGGYTPFMDPGAGQDGGRHIEFEITGSKAQQSWGRGVKFEIRREPIPAHILDQAIVPLDELLNIPTYEQVYEVFHQGQAPAVARQASGEAAPATAQHYECFLTGQYGGFQDCTTCCPDADQCKTAGCAPGYAEPTFSEPDIPSNPVLQPQPGPEMQPAAEAQAPPPGGLPPRTGAPAGGKPPLLRRGAQ